MTVLKTQNLTKRYGGKAAVDNVSLTVEKGDIFGLIGQNGAGKTTLMRLVTSLARPDNGEIELFEQSSPAGLNAARARMGCVVEMPALYPSLTAVQNLEYYRVQRGIPDKFVVQKSLEQVNLTDTGKKKFKNFSLGMNWNLGVMLNKDNQITIGHKRKKEFKAMLDNYMRDRKSDTSWDRHDIQVLGGLISYYRMVEKEYIDYLLQQYSQKHSADIEKCIKTDKSALIHFSMSAPCFWPYCWSR
jgi:ABC-2 type transport system ATP-binding protein